jgi:hypothetical protein
MRIFIMCTAILGLLLVAEAGARDKKHRGRRSGHGKGKPGMRGKHGRPGKGHGGMERHRGGSRRGPGMRARRMPGRNRGPSRHRWSGRRGMHRRQGRMGRWMPTQRHPRLQRFLQMRHRQGHGPQGRWGRRGMPMRRGHFQGRGSSGFLQALKGFRSLPGSGERGRRQPAGGFRARPGGRDASWQDAIRKLMESRRGQELRKFTEGKGGNLPEMIQRLLKQRMSERRKEREFQRKGPEKRRPDRAPRRRGGRFPQAPETEF